MRPERLSILGVGLLGGSIGLAVKVRQMGCAVVGYGHRQASLDAALEAGAIDQAFIDPAEAVRGADLVVLCTPVGTFESVLQAIAPALMPGAIVTDVGSTKASIVRMAHLHLPATAAFVGSHPMAGSEKRGVEFARADLFEDAVCIITPDESTPPNAIEKVEAFWKSLGMRTTRVSPLEHDRRLSDVSHLPHAVAAALVAIQDPASFDLAGRGFSDTTRIAAGDAGLWRDIMMDNRDNLLGGIERLSGELAALSAALRLGDADAVHRWLDVAAIRRAALARKSDTSPPRC